MRMQQQQMVEQHNMMMMKQQQQANEEYYHLQLSHQIQNPSASIKGSPRFDNISTVRDTNPTYRKTNSKSNLKEPSSFLQDTTAVSINNQNELSFLDNPSHFTSGRAAVPTLHATTNASPDLMNNMSIEDSMMAGGSITARKQHQQPKIQQQLLSERNPFKKQGAEFA